jgi:hypothetical protein
MAVYKLGEESTSWLLQRRQSLDSCSFLDGVQTNKGFLMMELLNQLF